VVLVTSPTCRSTLKNVTLTLTPPQMGSFSQFVCPNWNPPLCSLTTLIQIASHSISTIPSTRVQALALRMIGWSLFSPPTLPLGISLHLQLHFMLLWGSFSLLFCSCSSTTLIEHFALSSKLHFVECGHFNITPPLV